jgi:hypothetical protein
MRISIFGLGYVGMVSLACLARDGHNLICVGIDPVKVELIQGGRSPVIEDGLPELVGGVVRSGRVVVTDDAGLALHNSDISSGGDCRSRSTIPTSVCRGLWEPTDDMSMRLFHTSGSDQ